MLDDEHGPVEPVDRFLAYLASIERSPTTSRRTYSSRQSDRYPRSVLVRQHHDGELVNSLVRTALGDITASTLGRADDHEHLFQLLASDSHRR